MFDLWYELPTWARALMGVGLLALAGLVWLATGGTVYTIGIGALGLVFLLFCNAGNSSGGYKF